MAKIDTLINGYKRFYSKYFLENNQIYQKLVTEGQSPKTLVIACSDSRVDPSIITDANPGDIFVVRNVANLVPPYQPKADSLHGISAALEFAVNFLKVEHIVILGHSGCGGIKALLDYDELKNDGEFSFINSWIKIAQPAKQKVLAKNISCETEKTKLCEQESIIISLENLMTFPWIKSKVLNNELELHGWYFNLNNGALEVLSLDDHEFRNIAETNEIVD